jgi:threonine dehydratase
LYGAGKYVPTVKLEDIQRARQSINDIVPATPVLRSIYLSEKFNCNVYLKLENLNITGSFKIRGATNALRSMDKSRLAAGVVAASAGNHAQAVAYVCKELGLKSKIFMPEFTPLIKVESTKRLGAEIHLQGDTLDDAYEEAIKYEKETGAMMVHPYADAAVIAGQGTIGLELLEQVPDLDAVVVPIGGGGMIGGTGCAIKSLRPEVGIYGVQTMAFPSMYESLKQGAIAHVKRGPTIADGIAVKAVRPINFELLRQFVDEVFLVGEDQIAASVMDLIERNHLLAEGAGAASVAALEQVIPKIKINTKAKKAHVVCVIGGGNIDINLMRRITLKGLIHSGRVMRLRARISDRPGGLAALLQLMAKCRANIIEVYHDREFNRAHYNDVEVNLNVETSGFDHQDKIKAALEEKNIEYSVHHS